MKAIRSWLLGKLLTDAQRARLGQPLLNPGELEMVAALREPSRWQPVPPITDDEFKQWGQMLKAPLMLKIDLAMINMAQTQAQMAVHAPVAEVVRMAGYAAGFRGAWQMAKSLSTVTAAEGRATEEGADTAEPVLDHLRP